MDDIAKLLHERPNLNLFVVGHTDNVGEFDFNLKLSKDRANAVVAALVRDYEVAVSRLSAHGVGPLSPKATNASDAGRGKNRRVELVAR